jgi:hypothetical protein
MGSRNPETCMEVGEKKLSVDFFNAGGTKSQHYKLRFPREKRKEDLVSMSWAQRGTSPGPLALIENAPGQ